MKNPGFQWVAKVWSDDGGSIYDLLSCGSERLTFRGSKTDVENAAKKFSNNSTWVLTSVKCDAETKTEYVSSPIKYVVALQSSKLEPKDNQNLPKILKPTFADFPWASCTTLLVQ